MIQKDTYLMIHFIANKSSILEDRAARREIHRINSITVKSTAALRQTLTEGKLLIASRFSVTPILVGRFKF